ncbi:MAG TPA: hypothetical protein VGN81_22610 [Pseudonocardiaceae bacterium]
MSGDPVGHFDEFTLDRARRDNVGISGSNPGNVQIDDELGTPSALRAQFDRQPSFVITDTAPDHVLARPVNHCLDTFLDQHAALRTNPQQAGRALSGLRRFDHVTPADLRDESGVHLRVADYLPQLVRRKVKYRACCDYVIAHTPSSHHRAFGATQARLAHTLRSSAGDRTTNGVMVGTPKAGTNPSQQNREHCQNVRLDLGVISTDGLSLRAG